MSDLVAPIIPKGTDAPIGNFMKGFALMAEITHRRQVEELKAQQMIQDASLENRKLDITAEHNDQIYEIHKKQQERIAESEKYTKGQAEAQLVDTTDLMREINAITAPRDSQEWRNQAYDALLKHPGAARSPEYNLISKSVNKTPSHPAVKSQQQVLDDRIKTLGLDKNAVYRALNNPDTYTSPVPNGSGQIGIYVGEQVKGSGVFENKGPLGPGKNKTTTVSPQKLYVPIPASTWEGLKTTFSSLNGESDGTARIQPQPNTDQHKVVWSQAKAAMGKKDPIAVKEAYQAKGYDPAELDLDTPP